MPWWAWLTLGVFIGGGVATVLIASWAVKNINVF